MTAWNNVNRPHAKGWQLSWATGSSGDAARTWASRQEVRVTGAKLSRLTLFHAGITSLNTTGSGRSAGAYQARPKPSPLSGSSWSWLWKL